MLERGEDPHVNAVKVLDGLRLEGVKHEKLACKHYEKAEQTLGQVCNQNHQNEADVPFDHLVSDFLAEAWLLQAVEGFDDRVRADHNEDNKHYD